MLNTNNSQSHKEVKRIYISPERRIVILRVLVCTCLLVTAVVCGYFSYTLFFNQESQVMNGQYESLAQEFRRV